jgi:hypothetical protein
VVASDGERASRSPHIQDPPDDITRDLLLSPIVQAVRARAGVNGEVLKVFKRHLCVKRSVTAVTRNEWGDSASGRPASFGRHLTISLIVVVVHALLLSCVLRRIAEPPVADV